MRLDETTDFSNVRVQCLGKEYPATESAWKCLVEVRALREERTNSHDERVRSFSKIENRFVREAGNESKYNAVSTMLAGFGLTGNQESETPKERLARFKSELRKDESSGSLRDTVRVIKGWLTW